MNLNGASDELEFPVKDNEVYVHNSWTDSVPTVIHGNGPAKVGDQLFFLLIDRLFVFCREV